MEKTIANKMSLYDVVTLIVPSALVCALYQCPLVQDEGNWITYVVPFGFVLMVGILLKSISIGWNGLWFRNNTDMIRQVQDTPSFTWKSCLCTFICAPVKYIFSCVAAYFYEPDKLELNEYYRKYNIAYNDSYSGKRIEFLETQIAFLQVWMGAMTVCLIGEVSHWLKWNWLNGYYNHEMLNGKYVCIAIYVCMVAMFILQKKLYRVVHETVETIEKQER